MSDYMEVECAEGVCDYLMHPQFPSTRGTQFHIHRLPVAPPPPLGIHVGDETKATAKFG